jgi:hypothetical protein
MAHPQENRTMRTTLAAALVVLAASAASARAQEPAAPAAADEQEAQKGQPREHIQVLQHPYEISSFYRSNQGSALDLGYEAGGTDGRYPIAGFYRSQGASRGAYSAFWTSGYGTGYGTGRMRGQHAPGLFGAPRHRALGLNGDLLLFAPFLAPVGPLSGAFFESR